MTQYFPESLFATYMQGGIAVSQEREARLGEIRKFIQERISKNVPVKLLFVCTHNSRRSQFGQLWAQVWGNHYLGEGRVAAFSGGTEVTAFHPHAIHAVKSAGFSVTDLGESVNPIYRIVLPTNGQVGEFYSKLHDDPANPQEDFCAIMTCSEADQACPYIAGASLRIALPYEDPKAFDGTPFQEEKYLERCMQIGWEMRSLFAE